MCYSSIQVLYYNLKLLIIIHKVCDLNSKKYIFLGDFLVTTTKLCVFFQNIYQISLMMNVFLDISFNIPEIPPQAGGKKVPTWCETWNTQPRLSTKSRGYPPLWPAGTTLQADVAPRSPVPALQSSAGAG